MTRPCPCRHDANICDSCERRSEARRDADDIPESDRAQRAEEQADRELTQCDAWFGAA